MKPSFPLSCRPVGMTLIELLVVIAVISLLIGASASIMRSPRHEVSVRGAVDASAALVEQASLLAKSSRTATRLVINTDPDSANFARQIAIYGRDRNGLWKIRSGPHILPRQTYFDESASAGFLPARYQFNQRNAQDGSTGVPVAAYEFDRNGHFLPPNGITEPRVVLTAGFVPEAAPRTLTVTAQQELGRSGFLLRRYGYVTRFEDASQIPSSTP